MIQTIEELAGVILGAVVLLDIFLLVLYARANRGIISKYLSFGTWRALVGLSQPFGGRRGSFLEFSGPIVLTVVFLTWGFLLSLAAALIIHPNLGEGVRSNHGPTPTDFLTALYVGGTSLAFVGASDFVPESGFFQMFFLFTSLVGVSTVTLTLAYLMELYSDLQARNTIGLTVHLLSAESGDAAEVLAALGPRGMFDVGYDNLTEWAVEITKGRESHQFYPVLFYFRFREPYYSVTRTALTSLDTVTLIKSALDESEYGWLKDSAAVEQLWRSTFLELKTLASFANLQADFDCPPDEQTRTYWQRRYAAGVERLRRAGIKTTSSGADAYISLRSKWDRYITLLAPRFAYNLDEIDPALAKVKSN